jgi:hypothetical protein
MLQQPEQLKPMLISGQLASQQLCLAGQSLSHCWGPDMADKADLDVAGAVAAR